MKDITYIATQNLVKDLSLKLPGENSQYKRKNTMKYREEDDPDNEKEEDAGVVHIVHGWIQQCQKEKVRLDKIIIIIQPPGCLHEVYTPVPSVVWGGHFYNYNSLHLTEVSQLLDIMTNEAISNQTHSSASLTLSMMMSVLPIFNDTSKH